MSDERAIIGSDPRPSLTFSRRARFCLALLGATWLAACQTPVPIPDAPPPSDQWKGRFSLTLTEPSAGNAATTEPREERAQGRFALQRQGNQIDLDLFSPFGQTLATARSQPGQAQLTTQDGQRFEAADADSLTEKALGWRLPVDALPGWLAGQLPANTSEPVVSQGWRVKVEQRFSNGSPQRLSAWWPQTFRADQRRLKLFVIVDGSGS